MRVSPRSLVFTGQNGNPLVSTLTMALPSLLSPCVKKAELQAQPSGKVTPAAVFESAREAPRRLVTPGPSTLTGSGRFSVARFALRVPESQSRSGPQR